MNIILVFATNVKYLRSYRMVKILIFASVYVNISVGFDWYILISLYIYIYMCVCENTIKFHDLTNIVNIITGHYPKRIFYNTKFIHKECRSEFRLSSMIFWILNQLQKPIRYTGVPPYPRVIRSKTYRGYVKPRIIPNAIYNVIFM
jgi:hypothetical protein